MMTDDRSPRVSVRMPAYNHEKYIAECLNSVLNQTFQDFEVVITDDGSTDGTVDVIRSFQDPRIKLVVFPENKGCNVAIEACGQRIRGEYTANICSDDAWEPEKLERQVRYMDQHPEVDAVFTRVKLINEDGDDFTDKAHFYSTVFDAPNRSKDQWLRHFFLEGNCLCIPSVLIRTDVYRELTFQDKRLASLGDFDLWIRFAMKHELHILDEKLTRFRVRAGEANASGNKPENHIRTHFEYKQLMQNFLDIDSVDRLLRIFPECSHYGQPAQEIIPYFLARQAIDTSDRFRQLWGLETIFNLLVDDEIAAHVHEKCGFQYKDLHRITSEMDVFALRTEFEYHQRMAQMNHQTAQQQVELSTAQSVGEQLIMQVNHQQIQLAELESEINRIHATISWRVTAPLRWARSLMKSKHRPQEGAAND